RHGEGNNATELPNLRKAFQDACFMAPGTVQGKDYEATDIEAIPWSDPVDLPDDPEAANIMLAAAARSRADCGPKVKRMQQVEEARSCCIATVADSAEQLARLVTFEAGTAVLNDDATKKAEQLEFDPRAIGLTFVLSKTRLDHLFPSRDAMASEPPKSTEF